MIVTRQKLKFQEALVSTMTSHVLNEPDPHWRAKYERDLRRDEQRLYLMRKQLASTQRNNVFPLPVRGGVEG